MHQQNRSNPTAKNDLHVAVTADLVAGAEAAAEVWVQVVVVRTRVREVEFSMKYQLRTLLFHRAAPHLVLLLHHHHLLHLHHPLHHYHQSQESPVQMAHPDLTVCQDL